jgi:hypothetical protein
MKSFKIPRLTCGSDKWIDTSHTVRGEVNPIKYRCYLAKFLGAREDETVDTNVGEVRSLVDRRSGDPEETSTARVMNRRQHDSDGAVRRETMFTIEND